MSNSSVPLPTLGPNGFVSPTEAAILTAVQSDMSQAFGGNLNPALNTPQGQLASSTAAIIGGCYDQFIELVNQVDPQYATGRMQDAIANIYFLQRDPARPTIVLAQCTGLPGTVIPINSQAIATDGTIYLTNYAATIESFGAIAIYFHASTPGAIACPIDALNSIRVAVPGWDSVLNPTAGVIGADVESAADFAYRMQQSVAVNATGSLPSIYAALFNVADVLDVYCTENVTDDQVVIGDQTLAPHSLWACVAGGAQDDIANAIWRKKSVGCNYNGNNPTIVYDMAYEIPRPQYTVNWWTATPTPIKFIIRIVDSIYLPADAVALIKAAIIASFSGSDGGQTARIGSTLYASRYYAPVLAVAKPGSSIEILSLYLGIVTATESAITMGIDQIPTIDESDITVTLV